MKNFYNVCLTAVFFLYLLFVQTANSMECALDEYSSTENGSALPQYLHKVGEDVYQHQAGDNHYYVLEKATEDNYYNRWRHYAIGTRCEIKGSSACRSMKDKSAMNALDIFVDFVSSDISKAWIAYSLSDSYENVSKLFKDVQSRTMWHKKVEMSLAIYCDPKDRFQIHMGILRNPYFQGSPHKNMSLELHSFAARSMKEFYPNIELMVTKPLPIMGNILANNLEPEQFWWEKHPAGKKAWVIENYNRNEDYYEIAIIGKTGPVYEYKSDRSKKWRKNYLTHKYGCLLDIDIEWFVADIEGLTNYIKK